MSELEEILNTAQFHINKAIEAEGREDQESLLAEVKRTQKLLKQAREFIEG